MSAKSPLPPAAQTLRLMADMLDFRYDPYTWVMYAFPWGNPNGPLANRKGPNEWQTEELKRIGEHVRNNVRLMAEGKDPSTYKLAVVSGRGVGKSTFVAWMTLWMLSVHFGSSTIISANTFTQIADKTYAEIGKWLSMLINRYWFEDTQMSIKPAAWFQDALQKSRQIGSKYYYANGVLWNEDSPDSFVGAHNELGMLVIFDEASGIPENIWTASRGFFTEKSPFRFWLVFSNPRSNTGAFFDCFHSDRDNWNRRHIDARTIKELDQKEFQEIIKKFGEDSDEARIEVRGEFPHQGVRQFINRGIVADARAREYDKLDDHAPLCMGVDPARYGDDYTVIRFRQGRDARSFPPIKLKGADNMKVANTCAELIERHNPDAVFIDSGAGAGIIDRLREMGYIIYEVQFGGASGEEEYADHRTELWGKMREWLREAMLQEHDKELEDDLCGPEYEFTGASDKIKLESKEKMKKRGLHSPDDADALAVTFHAKVARKDLTISRRNSTRTPYKAKGRDYKIFG